MGTNLLDFVKSHFSPALMTKIAGLVGEKSTNTQKALDILLPSVLGGLTNKATTLTGADKLLDLINEGGHDGRIFDTLGALLGGGVVTQGVLKIGEGVVTTLFGLKLNDISDWVASQSGIKTGSATTLMNLTAPLLMGAIGKQLDGKGSASTLIALLGSQLPLLKNIIPDELLGLLNLSNLSLGVAKQKEQAHTPISKPLPKAPVKTEKPLSKPQIPTQKVEKTQQTAHITSQKADLKEIQQSKKIAIRTENKEKTLLRQLLPWLVLLGAAVFGLLWLRMCKSSETSGTPTVAEGAKVDSSQVVSAMGEKTLKLPDGELKVKAGSFLDLLYTTVTDEKADLSKPLTFDNVNFPKNQTSLTDSSKTQLNDLVKIMKAYPKFDIKINGYTDSRGDADENKKLSSGRAASVKEYLSAHDINDDRMKTEGFGAANPITSNETEDGRIKNRRIEVVITKKQ